MSKRTERGNYATHLILRVDIELDLSFTPRQVGRLQSEIDFV